MEPATTRRLREIEIAIDRIDGIIQKTLEDLRKNLQNKAVAAQQVSLTFPSWEYLKSGSQPGEGIVAVLNNLGSVENILSDTGRDMLLNEVRELLQNHFNRELSSKNWNALVSLPDFDALVDSALKSIQQAIDNIGGRYVKLNWFSRVLGWLHVALFPLVKDPTRTMIDYAEAYRLRLGFEKALNIFNQAVQARKERFNDEISEKVASAANTLETAAQNVVNSAIEDLMQRLEKAFNDVINEYQQQKGGIQQPAIIQFPVGVQWQLQQQSQQQLLNKLLTDLETEFKKWVAQMSPQIMQNLSNQMLQVRKEIVDSAVQVVNELINVYKEAYGKYVQRF